MLFGKSHPSEPLLVLTPIQSWALHAQRSWSKDTERLNQLRSLLEPALICCAQERGEAVELLIDLLSNYTSFFLPEHLSKISALLRSPWGHDRLALLERGESTDLEFGRLLLAYGEASVQEIITDCINSSSAEIMGTCGGLFVVDFCDLFFGPLRWRNSECCTHMDTKMCFIRYDASAAPTAWIPCKGRRDVHTRPRVLEYFRRICHRYPVQQRRTRLDSLCKEAHDPNCGRMLDENTSSTRRSNRRVGL